MYIIQINKDTAEFIGRHFNNGATPEIDEYNPTYYVVADDPENDYADIIDSRKYLEIMAGKYHNPGSIVIEKV